MIDIFWQANLAIGLFYLTYIILFKDLTFFRLNRLILLLIPFVALIIPAIRVQEVNEITASFVLPALPVDGLQKITHSVPLSASFWINLVAFTYVSGLIISFLLFSFRLIKLLSFIKKQDLHDEYGYKVAVISSSYSSFSFFNYILINKLEEESASAIVRHEQYHFRLLHSIDNMMFECLKCLFWFNPFIYLIHKELRKIHEYEVDSILQKQEGSLAYLDTVADKVLALNEMKLSNPYKSNSNLLNRIKMMYRKPTKSIQRVKYLVLLPIVIGVLILAACSNELDKEDVVSAEAEESIEVFPTDKMDKLSKQPEFPGGIEAMYAYLSSEINYPEKAKLEGLSGKVYISFVITQNGEVAEVKVIKGIHPLLDEEAKRVITNMPVWMPGEFESNKVAVQYMLPIQFTLSQDKAEIRRRNYYKSHYQFARYVPAGLLQDC